MKFCSECGVRLPGRTSGPWPRVACERCGAVFYLSPRLAAACIAYRDDRVLLCRRAVDPGYGMWSLPGGFVEKGESVASGAAREFLEEAWVVVEIARPYALFRVARGHQMHVVYLAKLLDTAFRPGAESLEAALFDESGVPWNHLAFASTREALRRYFGDRRRGVFGFLYAEIMPFAPAVQGDWANA